MRGLIDSLGTGLLDEFYLLVTRKNSSLNRFLRKTKTCFKDCWNELTEGVENNEGFRDFYRNKILDANDSTHILSLYALLSKFALMRGWRKANHVSDIIEFLKIRDPLIVEYEKILNLGRKPNKSNAYKLGVAYRDEFETQYNFNDDRFCLEVALLYSSKASKFMAIDAARGLNMAYKHDEEMFEVFDNKTIPSFFRKNRLPKIGLQEWEVLSADCKESISWNKTLQPLLTTQLRKLLKVRPHELNGSFHAKILKAGGRLKSVLNRSSLTSDERLDLEDEDDVKASIVLKHPRLNEIENDLITHLISAGKTWRGVGWEFPLTQLQKEYFTVVKRNTSAEFFQKIVFLSDSQSSVNALLGFSNQSFTEFWKSFPNSAAKAMVGGREIKDFRKFKLLVDKFKSCGIPLEFYQKVPKVKGWWTLNYDYKLTNFDINTFPLWLEDFRDDDSMLVLLIKSNFSSLSRLIRKPDVCRSFLRHFSGTSYFGQVIGLLEKIFVGNLHVVLDKLCSKEWRFFLRQCYAEGIKNGKVASDVFMWMYNLDPKFCKKILHRNVSEENGLALLRKIEFSPEVTRFIRAIRLKDSRSIVDLLLGQGRLCKAAIRFLKEVPKSEFSKVFVRHPKQLLTYARKRLTPSKLFRTCLENNAVAFAIHHSFSNEMLLDFSKIASRAYRGKPTVILAAKTAVLFSPMDFRFLNFLAFRRCTQGRVKSGSHFDDQYTEWKIPKKNGGEREIASPNNNLKRLQRRIMESLSSYSEVHSAVHGFVPKRGIRSNASEHVGKKIVANVDIASFFPSTNRKMVFEALLREAHLPADVCGFIAEICLRKGGLPAGAPTSPILGNLVLKKFDEVMTKTTKGSNACYTRYADDITISGDDKIGGLIWFAGKLLNRSGYSLNKKKTNFFRRGRRQMVTGLSVNEKVNVPKRVRRNLRAAIHARSLGKDVSWNGRSIDDQVLEGLCAFVKSINPKDGKRQKKNLTKALKS